MKKTKSVAKSKKPKSKVSKSNVVSFTELYELKKAKEKEKAEAAEAWKHKKNLPPHEQGPVAEDIRPTADMRKTGFGGARHH